MPVLGYIYPPPTKLEFSPELWRQRNIVKCSICAEAVDNHNVGYFRWAPNLTGSENISGSIQIRTQGLRCTIPLSY